MMVRVLVDAVERMAARRQDDTADQLDSPDKVETLRSRFFSEAGLAGAPLDDIHARIPLVDFKRAIRAALKVSGEPALGLHMGEQMSSGSFDVMGVLVEQCDTLRDSLQMAMRYQRIMSALAGFDLNEQGDTATIGLSFPDPEEPEAQLGAEFASVGLLRAIRTYVGPDALPRRASFVYPAPAHRAQYTRRFGGRELFSQPFTGLQIDRSWLDRRKPGMPSELQAYLKTRADFLLVKADKSVSAAERVRHWLASQPSAARMTMDVIARDLGTSERSLRRRLQDERVHFNALVEESLSGRAKRMLADPGRSVQETAYALGFSTASAFSRAFKRWTGMAPSDFRSAR